MPRAAPSAAESLDQRLEKNQGGRPQPGTPPLLASMLGDRISRSPAPAVDRSVRAIIQSALRASRALEV
ncbi:MAG: hypothetical protein ABFC63_03765 [Thermoguttaceae bacterium]